MSNDNEPAVDEIPGEKKKPPFLTKSRLVAAGIALGGMIVGSFVGIGVQMGVESTGLLGPSVEALLEEQEANFSDINARLQDLKNRSTDPAVKKGLTDLGKLLARQGELQHQANTELAYLGDQIANLKQESLDERGFAGGADFWLKTGESVSVGDGRHVLGVVRTWNTAVDVNMNGKKSRLSVGDSVSTDSCTVFFKQAGARPDGRVGFDLSCG
ncbi:MAG: hypothetical protein OER22_04970 [Gammaproteobacteria bacterium]|nr:hypothetical protein [Gammaproteobacteria bacterium]MDH3373123.1 hypothetical protein [Gammaproteobacteria bacterium]MDH3409644.1 hypothetical protein [Gammaproteobacteria bacterium]MDH3551947.1 hypothetical protein [Gammaproteobacteria bacterium]